MRIAAIGLGLAFVFGLATIGRTADEPGSAGQTLDIWPGAAPGEPASASKDLGKEIVEHKSQELPIGKFQITRATNITQPTIAIFSPDRAKNTGAAVVVCPGGGYSALMMDYEGTDIAQWLKSIGVTGIVLKYRVPRREGTPKNAAPPQALMDAQRALSLVRSKAADLGIDPKRIGILGFSAGGHLAAWAATNSDKRVYEPIDAVDRVDCRPDFAIPIYPGSVIKRGTDQTADDIRVTSQTPPMFLAQAGNDNPESSIFLYLALKRAGVPAELHVYAGGGHGFGIRSEAGPASTWTKSCEDWLRAMGFLKPGAKP
jgi:acetyl esterase/lipase